MYLKNILPISVLTPGVVILILELNCLSQLP